MPNYRINNAINIPKLCGIEGVKILMKGLRRAEKKRTREELVMLNNPGYILYGHRGQSIIWPNNHQKVDQAYFTEIEYGQPPFYRNNSKK
jgi:hypothetical protein